MPTDKNENEKVEPGSIGQPFDQPTEFNGWAIPDQEHLINIKPGESDSVNIEFDDSEPSSQQIASEGANRDTLEIELDNDDGAQSPEKIYPSTLDLTSVDLPEPTVTNADWGGTRLDLTSVELPDPQEYLDPYKKTGQTGYVPSANEKAHRGGMTVLLQTALAGLIGGFLAWMFLEPSSNDNATQGNMAQVLGEMGLFGGVVGAVIAASIGAVDGITSRVYQKAVRGGLIGLGVGLAGGFIGGVAGQIFYGIMGGGAGQSGMGTQVIVRALAWSLVGLFVGLGQGISSRSPRKIINGLIGGLIGGGIGGMMFDPISMIFTGAEVSRAVGITLMGACTGIAIGLVEEMTKQAWLHVVKGLLAGKEFILYHKTTTVGSSPACEIVLFKDPDIAPEHFRIQIVQGGYELQASSPTMVNDRPVRQVRLRNNDRITVGQTIFVYSERAAKGSA